MSRAIDPERDEPFEHRVGPALPEVSTARLPLLGHVGVALDHHAS